MDDFDAGCYDDKGNVTMSEDALNTVMAERVALKLEVATQQEEITNQDSEISSLQTDKIELQADLDAAGSCKDASEKTPTWAIAMIAVVGAMFLLVFLTLVVLVKRCAPHAALCHLTARATPACIPATQPSPVCCAPPTGSKKASRSSCRLARSRICESNRKAPLAAEAPPCATCDVKSAA